MKFYNRLALTSSATLLGIFLLITSANAATWIDVQTPSTQKITGITYVDATHILAVGEKGDLLISTNAGAAWHKLASVPDDVVAFKAIVLQPFTTRVFAVGGLGKIWTSADGGLVWTAQTQITNDGLRAIAAGGNQRLVAVGENGKIIMTNDNGSFWTVQNFGGEDLNGVRYGMSDVMSVWAVGMKGTILHSTNGGVTWVAQNSNTTEDLYDVFFDGTIGFAVGSNGTIMRSFNGGELWQKVTTLPTDLSSFTTFYRIAEYSGASFSTVASLGYVFTTYDAGTTWIQSNDPNKAQLTYTIATNNSLSHVLVGTDKGAILQLTIPIPPSQPAFVKGPVAAGSVTANTKPTITWGAASVSASTIAGYEIKINNGAFTPIGNVWEYTPSAALTNGSYTFSVRAVSLEGTYGKEASYSLTVQAAAAPIVVVPDPVPLPQPPVVVPVVQPQGLNVFNGVVASSLVKLACPPNAGPNDICRAVYFIDNVGKRHAFPNAKVYASWYSNFDSVQIVDAATLASFQLGKNVTYRAGGHMVKFITSPVVYAVTKLSVIRPIASADVAQSLYGTTWNKQIDDVSDVFAGDYAIGMPISVTADYSVGAEQSAAGSLLEAF